MDRERKVIFPDELIEDRVIELTLFPSNSNNVGVSAISGKEDSLHVLRIFQLLYSLDDESYHPIQEMAAFSFESQNELDDFLEKLPNLNGIEMLMLLNPIAPDPISQH